MSPYERLTGRFMPHAPSAAFERAKRKECDPDHRLSHRPRLPGKNCNRLVDAILRIGEDGSKRVQKLIVVEGKKGSGKTSAIHEAAKLLGCGLTINSPADIFMITYLKLGTTKFGIGIASSGDSAQIIKENIDALYPHHLDYIITACSAPRAGMPVLQGFAALERAQLVTIQSTWQQNATAQQIGAKVAAIAQQIRSQIP